jgi:signal transduction histidine kinase
LQRQKGDEHPGPVGDEGGEALLFDDFSHDSCKTLTVDEGMLGDPLDHQQQFESLLFELTTRFVNLPVHEIDDQIGEGLRRLGQFLQIDRSSFAEFSEDKRDMLVLHCYTAPGIAPFPRVIVDGKLPWYAEQIRRGEVLRFSRLPDELPPEAVAERECVLRDGVKSNLAIPLRSGGALNWVITFGAMRDYREWSDELVQRLWVIGEIFANAIVRKRAELKTQQLRERLTRMARINLVGELAAAIAHEVNQPLCAIVTNAQAGQRLLAAEHANVNEVRETLHDIAADSRRANDVIVRIRSMLQNQTPEHAPLQLGDAIREAVSLIYGPALQKGVSVALHVSPQLPMILGDRIQLQQVILNLALNALDAMNQPEIETRHLSIHAECASDESVIIVVSDTGPGIDCKLQDEVFETFFTTKPTGLGVGLAISRSIVESHGGSIWVESELGRGAAFYVKLPVAKKAPA